VLVVYPLAMLLLQIVFPELFSPHMSWHFSLTALMRVLENPLNMESIVNSTWMGVVAAILSVIIGTLTAFGVMMASGPLRTFINMCVWMIFFAPSFIIASGWVILLQGGGVLQQLLNLSPNTFDWFFTPVGLFFVMALRYFPFAHFAMTQAIQNVGAEYILAARTLGAGKLTILFRIWLRLLAPALLAGGTIAFAEGFSDFGLASVLTPNMQIPLVSYQIYTSLYELPVDFSSAAVLSLLAIIVTSGALLLQFWWLNRRSFGTISGSSLVTGLIGSKGRIALVAITIIITVLGLVLPFGATLIQSFWKSSFAGFSPGNWTMANYVSAFQVGGQGLQALGRSAEYALITALAVMVAGLYIGQQMTFNQSLSSRILNTITMATIAIPGVVLGVGYVFAWNAQWLEPLHLAIYETPVCLAMAYMAVHLPYAVRLQLSAMKQISPNLLSAAQILGAHKRLILRVIVLPLVLETVISTFLIAFTGTMFELPAATLLYPPGQPPFSVVIDHMFSDANWAAGSALTMVGMVIVFGSYVSGNYLLRKVFGKSGMSDDTNADNDVSHSGTYAPHQHTVAENGTLTVAQ
jgi:iron(III) transport system permease protein